MRVRKKPDLRIDIPAYPHDYVEMPPETKRLILEANTTPNDLQYIDDDTPSSSHFQIGSPVSPGPSNAGNHEPHGSQNSRPTSPAATSPTGYHPPHSFQNSRPTSPGPISPGYPSVGFRVSTPTVRIIEPNDMHDNRDVDNGYKQPEFQIGSPISPIEGPVYPQGKKLPDYGFEAYSPIMRNKEPKGNDVKDTSDNSLQPANDGDRAPTPTIKIIDSEEKEHKQGDKDVAVGYGSPVMYRKLKRTSVSMPHGLQNYELEALRQMHADRVSRNYCFY